jgi:hypothetical protein
MNARTTKVSQRREPLTSRDLRRRGTCRRCPLCAPSGQCREIAIRSGRCGDWVWYMLGSKQFRRLWVKPRDPRSPSQRQWRARLGAASNRYKDSLTDEQQDDCIAAGAKLRCRPRLGPSGVLTGQQYWVRQACARKAEGGMQNAETAGRGLQTQEISLPTWEPHRGITGAPPGNRRRNTRRSGKNEDSTRIEACTSQRVRPASEVSVFRPCSVRCPPFRVFAAPQHPKGWKPNGVKAAWLWQRGAFGQERAPPAPSCQSHAEARIFETRVKKTQDVECRIVPAGRWSARTRPPC